MGFDMHLPSGGRVQMESNSNDLVHTCNLNGLRSAPPLWWTVQMESNSNDLVHTFNFNGL